jgi:hypothetical protein
VVFAALGLVRAAHQQVAESAARDGAVIGCDAGIDPAARDDFAGRFLEHADGALIHQLHQAIAIRGHQHHLRQVQVQAIELALILQRGQCLATQRGVVQIAHEPGRITAGDAPDTQEHRKFAAVAMAHAHVAALSEYPALAGGEITLHVTVMLLPVARGHQHVDVAAQRVRRAITEHLLGGRVECQDPAALVRDHDGVERSLQQSEYVRCRRGHAAQDTTCPSARSGKVTHS